MKIEYRCSYCWGVIKGKGASIREYCCDGCERDAFDWYRAAVAQQRLELAS